MTTSQVIRFTGPDTEALVASLAAWLTDGTAPPAATTVIIDGRLVDVVLVRDALEGTARWRLSIAERRLVVAVGTRAGRSSRQLARCTGITARSVVRHRRSLRGTP